MINFSKDSVFNLKPCSESEVRQEVYNLFVSGEKIIGAYKTIRDQLIFTTKRIICIDVQGLTGKKKEYASLPYSKVHYFSVQTPGFMEKFVPDCELMLYFSGGRKMQFEFKGGCDIIAIGQSVSEYVLK